MSLLDKCGEIVHDCALRIERMTLRPHSLSEIEIELRCLLEGLAPAASLESKAAAWDTINAKLTELTGSEDWLVDFDKNGTQCAIAVIERFANPLHTIDMLLFCPRCQKQHIDAADTKEEYTNRLHESSWWESGGEKPARWMNPPHATHTCRYCGLLWRPSNANTNGVENIPALENKHVARIIASSPAGHLTMDPLVRSEIKRIAGLIEEYLPKEMNAEGAAFNLALTRGEWRSILCGLRK